MENPTETNQKQNPTNPTETNQQPNPTENPISSLETTLKPLLLDFVADLSRTFPEKSYLWQHWTTNCDETELARLKKYFVSIYPERFFDILYQNETIFTDPKTNTCFLPNVQFSELFAANITENTKQTLWKYLQLILFQTVDNVDNKNAFGEAAQLFQGLNEADLQEKMNETLDGLKDFFQQQHQKPNTDEKPCNTPNGNEDATPPTPPPFEKMFENLNAEGLQEHLKKLMGGKIGSLVEELVGEMKDDLAGLEKEFGDIDPNNLSMQDVMKKMMKDPAKMMGIMKKMADKVKTKMAEGGNQEEYMKETANILKEMGGKEEFMKMFESMRKGMPNGGKNMKMDENALNRMQKGEQVKERMRRNVELKKQQAAEAMAAANAAKAAGCRVEQTADGNKVFRIAGEETAAQKSTKEDIDRIMQELNETGAKQPATTTQQPKKKNNKNK